MVSSEEQAELQRVYDNKGMTGCLEYIEGKKTQWKQVPLKVGVIGATGVGKSSFINAIRGLRSGDEGAALVDVNEATQIPTEYSHPCNAMLKFWDLPGVGTTSFPKDKYLSQIDVDSYDCFVIITAGRFTDTDMWLAQEIVSREKNFYFVRSKIFVDVSNDMYEKRLNHKEEDVLKKIRDFTSAQLNKRGFANRVFLIDNHKREKYDFDELELTIIEDLPSLKRQAMILSLSVCTDKMIKVKADELRKRVWHVALASAAVAAIPIPGVSIAFDAVMLIKEMKFYFEQLGLDDLSLRRRSQFMSVDTQVLFDVVKLHFPLEFGVQLLKQLAITGGFVALMLGLLGGVIAFIPIVGLLVTAPISYVFTKYALNNMLDEMEKTSLELTTFFLKKEL